MALSVSVIGIPSSSSAASEASTSEIACGPVHVCMCHGVCMYTCTTPGSESRTSGRSFHLLLHRGLRILARSSCAQRVDAISL